jgi:hypothetical protein
MQAAHLIERSVDAGQSDGIRQIEAERDRAMAFPTGLIDARHPLGFTSRTWMRAGVSAGLGLLEAGCGRGPWPVSPEPEDVLARFPGKIAMRVVKDRPPCLETPCRYYRHDLTPNEAFYVRWHLQSFPTSVYGKS